MKIELLWFKGCPNHAPARLMLRRVLAARGLSEAVEEVEVRSDDDAVRLRFTGSPTIRVNGIDVDPGFVEGGAYAMGCRVYVTGDGLRGVPERAWVEQAVARALTTERDGAFRRTGTPPSERQE